MRSTRPSGIDGLFALGEQYRSDPIGFARVFLGVTLSDDQKHILTSLHQPPHRVMVRSCNSAGKSFIAAVAALHCWTCYNPSVVIVTAPTAAQVQRILFKELRALGHVYADLFLPKASVLYHTPQHQIIGYTSGTSVAFQGLHTGTVSAIVDEATGVDGEFIEAIEPMVAGPGHYTLLLYNPTDASSYVYQLERAGKSHVVHLSALNHPNITAELTGQPAPFPNAVRLGRLREMIDLWCDPADDPKPEDFQFEGRWWHPSPVGEIRLLGSWPSQPCNAIWSQALFDRCCANDGQDGPIQVGCDVAAFGDDDTTIAVRRGTRLIFTERHNGWSPNQTAARLKDLSQQYRVSPTHNPPVVIDETGVGVAVTCLAEKYNFVGCNFSSRPRQPDQFRHRRDELHFDLCDAARKNNVSFKHIPSDQREALRLELLAPMYEIDASGKRCVEPKKKIKERLGASPDLAEAVLLAYASVNADVFEVKPPVINRPQRQLRF